MPEEWPIAAPAADGNGAPRRSRGGRLATVRRDFFLNPGERLTEQERALMTAMLQCLVSDVADAVRAALPSGRIAANDEGDAALVDALTASGLLDEPGLMAAPSPRRRGADRDRCSGPQRPPRGARPAGPRQPRLWRGCRGGHGADPGPRAPSRSVRSMPGRVRRSAGDHGGASEQCGRSWLEA